MSLWKIRVKKNGAFIVPPGYEELARLGFYRSREHAERRVYWMRKRKKYQDTEWIKPGNYEIVEYEIVEKGIVDATTSRH